MPNPIYRFRDYEIDPAARLLRKQGAAIVLAPKAFGCIVYLIEHRDRAVGRDELIAAVWGKVDVSDNVLGQVIVRARRAFDTAAEELPVIRTVPRFGYQWAVDVEMVQRGELTSVAASGAAAPAPPVAVDGGSVTRTPAKAPDEAVRPGYRHARIAAGVGLAMLLLLAAVVWWRRSAPLPNARIGDDAVLVLPVQVQADGEHGWIRLGVMDLIAERLRGAGATVVPSDNVVALLRNLGSEAPDAGDVERLSGAAQAPLVLRTDATFDGERWHITLVSVHGRASPLRAGGQAADVLEAARAAADEAARALGRHPPSPAESGGGQATDRLQRQIEADLLAQQIDTARERLAGLAPALRGDPSIALLEAQIALLSGQVEAAQSRLQELLDQSPAESEPLQRAKVLLGLGSVLYQKHDYAAVERVNDEAVRLLQRDGTPRELGRALHGRGIARSELGRHEAAAADFAQSRVVLESAGDRRLIAVLDANLGTFDVKRDHFAEAARSLERAIPGLSAYGIVGGELNARLQLAYARRYLLEGRATLRDEARIGELLNKLATPKLHYAAQIIWSDVLESCGRRRDAETLLTTVQAGAEEAHDTSMLIWIDALRAQRAWRSGDLPAAARAAEAVVKTEWAHEASRDAGQAWLIMVRSRLPRVDEATLEAMERWAARKDDSEAVRVYAALIRAEVAAAGGDNHAANAAYAEATEEAEAARVPYDMLQVAASHVDYLLRQHDLARASAVAGRLAGAAEQDFDAAVLQTRLYQALGQEAAWAKALAQVRVLAGERTVPPELVRRP